MPGMAELFPDKYPKGRQCCRTYMYNVWNTLYPEDVMAVINHANSQRFSIQNDQMKEDSIMITEAWKQELQSMPFISK